MTARTLSLLMLGAPVVMLLACQQPQEDRAVSRAAPAPPTEATSRDFGDFVVHFNAMPTDQLTAEIAKTYGIVRSPNRALLTVSIIKKQEGTTGSSVGASVAASASNLTGQFKQITIREIREGEAIYYIGEATVANEETLMFNVDVTPIDNASSFNIRFQKQFFTK